MISKKKMVLVLKTLLAKSLHDGHASEKSPVMALEETRARKELATNARGSTGTHHSKSMCAPSTKSIHHQGSEKMANLQRCKRITILGNLLAVNIAESPLASSRVEQVDFVLALGRQELPLARVVQAGDAECVRKPCSRQSRTPVWGLTLTSPLQQGRTNCVPSTSGRGSPTGATTCALREVEEHHGDPGLVRSDVVRIGRCRPPHRRTEMSFNQRG